jgi:hypothetical protein
MDLEHVVAANIMVSGMFRHHYLPLLFFNAFQIRPSTQGITAILHFPKMQTLRHMS